MDNIVRKMVVVDHLVHKYDENLCSVHHGGHPASHHGPPIGEGHGGASPKIQVSHPPSVRIADWSVREQSPRRTVDHPVTPRATAALLPPRSITCSHSTI